MYRERLIMRFLDTDFGLYRTVLVFTIEPENIILSLDILVVLAICYSLF